MIVLVHYPVDYLPDWFSTNFLIRESYVFVDFFFVLSGFVISLNYNTISTYKSFFNYMKKRIIRLYPLHFYSNFIFLIYAIFSGFLILKLFPQYFERSNYDFYQDVILFIDSIFLTNSTPLLYGTSGLNSPSWSISSEIISYLVFGLSLVFIKQNRMNFMFISIIIFSSIILYNNGIFFYTEKLGFLRGFIGFFSGYFVWKIYSLKKSFSINKHVELLLPILLLSILFLINFFGSENIILFEIVIIPIFFSISILILLNTNGLLTKILNSTIFNFLGKVSYSVYLNHLIILTIFSRVVFRVFKIEKTDLNMMVILMLSIILILIYSYLTHYFIENKFGKYLRKIFLKT